MLSEDYDIETESITDKLNPAGKDITMEGTKTNELHYILNNYILVYISKYEIIAILILLIYFCRRHYYWSGKQKSSGTKWFIKW